MYDSLILYVIDFFISAVITLFVILLPYVIVKSVTKGNITIEKAKKFRIYFSIYSAVVFFVLVLAIGDGSTFSIAPIIIWNAAGYRIIKPKAEKPTTDIDEVKEQEQEKTALIKELIDTAVPKDDEHQCPYCGNIQSNKISRCLHCSKIIEPIEDTEPIDYEAELLNDPSVKVNLTVDEPELEPEPEPKPVKKAEPLPYAELSDEEFFSINSKPAKAQKQKSSTLTAFLTVVIVLLLIACTFFIAQNLTYKSEVDELNTQVQTLQDDYDTLNDYYEKLRVNNSELSSDYNDLRNEMGEMRPSYDFFNEHAVCVDENSSYYHKYGCFHFDDSYFYIYNTEYAISKGYTPCPYCH